MGAGPDLTGLGRAVADAQDEALARTSEHERDRVRTALLASTDTRRAPSSAARHALVPVSVALAAAVAAILLWPAPGEREGFRVGDRAGRVGAWIAAPEGRSLPVEFLDGTKVKLARGARARVAAVTRHGGRVVLERGRASVSVVHHDGSRWLVHVGPYEVTVTGTEFDVGWDPAQERFELQMREGRVRVTGPLLGEGRSVVAGESVMAEVRGGRLLVEDEGMRPVARRTGTETEAETETETETEAEAEAETAAETETEREAQAARGREAEARATKARVERAPGGGAAWQALARAARFGEAMDAAEAAGFEQVCATASAGDLVLLADAARLAGRLPRAITTLETLRRRFAGSPQAAQAAFTLGRIAFDRRGAYAEAARWFGQYQREAPGGPFAREAAGRRIEALARSSDAAGAQAAAEQYLARYPNGPHADLARRVAGR